MVHADGSVLQTWDYLKEHGLDGFISIWPKPTATAWNIIAYYGHLRQHFSFCYRGKGLRARYRLLVTGLFTRLMVFWHMQLRWLHILASGGLVYSTPQWFMIIWGRYLEA